MKKLADQQRRPRPLPRGAERGRRLRRERQPRLALDRLAGAAAPDGDRRPLGELRRHRRAGRPPADRVHPRPQRPVAELAREHPALRPEPAGGGDGPARASACPRSRASGSRSSSTAGWSPSCASGSSWRPPCWWATRWAASWPPRWRSRAPEIVERLMLLSSAGVSQMDVAKTPGAGRGQGGGPAGHQQRGPDAHDRPPAQAAPLGDEPRVPPSQPDQARPDVRGPDEGRRQARLRGRAARLPRVRLPRAPAGDRLPHDRRVGREGHDHPGARRRQVRVADPGRAEGDLRGHRPRADARAPAQLQRLPGGVPRPTRSRRASWRGVDAETAA